MPIDDELFTPDEVLGGFSAKRARLLLFQIESQTAYLLMQSRRTVDPYLTEETAERQDLAFFEALAAGRNRLFVRRSAISNAMPRSGKCLCLPLRPCKPPWHTCWHRNTA
jgi:hypothetical protein